MDIRQFLQKIKEQTIKFDEFSTQYSANNNIEVLKSIAYIKIESFYWRYVEKMENKNIDDWRFFGGNFHIHLNKPNLKHFFDKYPLTEIIEKYLPNDLVFPSPIFRNRETLDYITENGLSEKKKIVSIMSGKKESLFCSFPTTLEGFNTLNKFKNVINEFTRINPYYITAPIMFDIIGNDFSYTFYGGEFLKNLINPGYNELKDLTIEYDLSASEILYLIFNLKNLRQEKKYLNSQYLYNAATDVFPKFSLENEYENEVIETVKGNYAKDKILKIVICGEQEIKSEFTDFQAFHICKGIRNQNALYNKFLNKNHTLSDTYRAHKVSMETLKKYGREMVGFILSLPELPFKCDNFKKIFSVLDKAKIDGNQNPSVTLKFKNSKNENKEISFSFFVEQGKSYANVMTVCDKNNKQEIMKISRNGLVVPKENTRNNGVNNNITPIIEFFYQMTETDEGFKNAVFSYGIETGKCSLCGRELTNTISKLKGIGPVCEKYFN